MLTWRVEAVCDQDHRTVICFRTGNRFTRVLSSPETAFVSASIPGSGYFQARAGVIYTDWFCRAAMAYMERLS
jgi:hypothetical protein